MPNKIKISIIILFLFNISSSSCRLWDFVRLPQRHRSLVLGRNRRRKNSQVFQSLFQSVSWHHRGPSHVGGRNQVEPLSSRHLHVMLGGLDCKNMGPQIQVNKFLKLKIWSKDKDIIIHEELDNNPSLTFFSAFYHWKSSKTHFL